MLEAMTRTLNALLDAITNLRMNDENRIKLYEAAKNALGTDASSNDEAPDELGCADTVSHIIKAAFGEYFTGRNIVSTRVLYQKLRDSSEYVEARIPTPGCIVISPTGYSRQPGQVGHVGIVMLDGGIASNNSFGPNKGRFTENFTNESWQQYYGAKGFWTKYYRPV